MTTAVILAGGYGTRLRPLTFNMPKALIPLVNKPVIDYILDYLVVHGLREFVITTNYLREQTIEYLNSSRADLKIAYPEEPSPLGTAGSVKNAGITDTLVIIQGDNITEIDLGKLMTFHKAHDGLVTIALLPVPDPSLYGIAEIEATGMIRNFKEKPAPSECFSNLANTGLYILEPEAMEYIPKGSAFDFSKNLFPLLVEQEAVYGCMVNGFWTDVGADTAELEDSEIQGNVVVGDYVTIKNSVIRGPAVIGNHASVLNSKLYNSVIFSGATVRETVLRNSVIEQNVEIKREEIRDSIR
jgi:mannose-1-phosphate guanylyltransferase